MSLTVFATCLRKNYYSVLIWQTTEIGVLFPVIAVLVELEKCSWFPFMKFSFWNNQDCSKHWPKKEGSFNEFPVMPVLQVLFFCVCERYESLIMKVTRTFHLFRLLIFWPKISCIQETAVFREEWVGNAIPFIPYPQVYINQFTKDITKFYFNMK